MGYYNRQKQPKTSPFDSKGFENWYKPFTNQDISNLEIFLVDFKTQIYQEEIEIESEVNNYDSEYEPDTQNTRTNTRYRDISGVVLYFLTYDFEKKEFVKGRTFLKHRPYFYLLLKDNFNPNLIIQDIYERYENKIENIEVVRSYDAGDLLFLKEKNFLKVEVAVPNLVPALRDRLRHNGIVEWREADIQYHHRVAIDFNLNIGNWYKIDIQNEFVSQIRESQRKDLPHLKLVAYDIETNSSQNKDPDPDNDIITMVSLYSEISSNSNVVIVNSEVIDCANVSNFYILIRDKDEKNDLPWIDWCSETDYQKIETDKNILNSYPMNALIVKNERELIAEFIKYLEKEKPDVLADFYGDKFDLPFFKVRAQKFGMNFEGITGFSFKKKVDKKAIANWMQDVDFVASHGVFHLDAYLWNLRYSYLPKKDLGLKPSVARKLKINPIGREALWQLTGQESDPGEAVAYAGSDGYITWRYVKEIILDFAISMGRMFPVNSSEVLTKTAGSLDDLLVDKIGHNRNIIAKQRFRQDGVGFFNSKINIQGITYTGGFVTAPNPGIWRKDLKYNVKINPDVYLELKDTLANNLGRVEEKILAKSKKLYFDTKIRHLFENDDDFFSYTNNSNIKNYLQQSSKVLKADDQEIRSLLKKYYQEANTLTVIDSDKKKEEIYIAIDNIIEEKGERTLKGIHLDVTSMYPSQIRQYKLQPSGIVDPSFCQTCDKRENQEINNTPVCAFDSPWTAKLSTTKPCIYKIFDEKTQNGYCEHFRKACEFPYSEETSCNSFDVGEEKLYTTEEFYRLTDDNKIEVYFYDNGNFNKKNFKDSYLARGFKKDQLNTEYIKKFFEAWVAKSIEGARINYNGDYPFRIESSGRKPILWDGFLYIDVKQKNSSFLISLESRFCQKAYDYMSSIMDMFFQERVSHKSESRRLSGIIRDKSKNNEEVSPDLIQRQKYHDSTQLGLKVPLNSIYGLLGMKGGVHNASLPSAGVTTSLSARLIQWSADLLANFGPITELDTDGVWFFIPEVLPTHYNVEVGFIKSESSEIYETASIPILEEFLNQKTIQEKSNRFYWENNGSSIAHSVKSLLSFEQDGPYDFQYVQGKKKYVVFNRTKDGKWHEEELTGLETKRADFSRLHKELQEQIINTFLSDWNKTSLKELYSKAVLLVENYVERIKKGDLEMDYFVLPKTIKKRPEEYYSQGPEVIAAYMLKDIGFTIEPGMKIDYYLIKPIKDPKNNIEIKVVPIQLFKLPFKDVKRFLKKRRIAKLEFQLGQVNSMKDIYSNILRIDYDSYIESLVGPGKISDRMIYSIAKKQNVILNGTNDISSEIQLDDLISNNSVNLSDESTEFQTKEQSKKEEVSVSQSVANTPVEKKLRKSLSLKPEKKSFKAKNKLSEGSLLNNFLDEELTNREKFLKSEKARISKLLPELGRFIESKTPEYYYCEYCKTDFSNIKNYSCPHCYAILTYKF